MKTCSNPNCLQLNPQRIEKIENFYKRTRSFDGLTPRCKFCIKNLQQSEDFKRKKRDYYQSPERREATKNFNNSPKRKDYLAKYRLRPEALTKDLERKSTEEYKQYMREYEKRPEVQLKRKSPTAKAKNLAKHLKRMYGLSLEEFERLNQKQNNCCAVCSRSPSELGRLYVDHCHQSGKIRGLLCQKCNSGLGLLGDTREALQKALKYIDSQEGEK
jgi:hypothetical protein